MLLECPVETELLKSWNKVESYPLNFGAEKDFHKEPNGNKFRGQLRQIPNSHHSPRGSKTERWTGSIASGEAETNGRNQAGGNGRCGKRRVGQSVPPPRVEGTDLGGGEHGI